MKEVILLIAAISSLAIASSAEIADKSIEPVNCISCHEAQAAELNTGVHLKRFTSELAETARLHGYSMREEEALSAACLMCHSYWDSYKQFGVTNFKAVDGKSYSFRFDSVVPWDSSAPYWENKNASYTRLDLVFENLSALSPNPGSLDTSKHESCGIADKGMCHIAAEAVVQWAARNSSIFYSHDITYTSMQYSVRSVKLCASCHVNKLPPMDREGKPVEKKQHFYWEYDANGDGVIAASEKHSIQYRTPGWAHQNVPCMKCHGAAP